MLRPITPVPIQRTGAVGAAGAVPAVGAASCATSLMQVANEASKTWIKSVYNTQYGIPNYLTSRRLNVRFRFDF